MSIVKALKLDEQVIKDIEAIAIEKNSTPHAVMVEAIKFYRDYYYMQNKASIINQDIINVCKAIVNNGEKTINYHTNKYLSELAIQNAITNMILAQSLEISPEHLDRFRIKAVDYLKNSQRVLKLDKLIE